MPEVTPQDSMQQVARQINEIHQFFMNQPRLVETASRPAQVQHTFFRLPSIPSRTEIFRNARFW